MTEQPRGPRIAFGAPGITPRWSHSNKDGVGTAYSADSRLWFTLWRGAVTETYFPTIDRPQLRDMQFLLTDGKSFFHEERRHLKSTTERPNDHALGYRIESVAPDRRYRLFKTIIGDPHLPTLLEHVRVETRTQRLAEELRMFVLAAPHLDNGGWGNNAMVIDVLDQPILVAQKNNVALALGCTVPFLRASVGYVGHSDGWTDVSHNLRMAYEFDQAPDGNVALTGEIPVETTKEFTVGLAFGETVPAAITALFQSLRTPFDLHYNRFLEQWSRTVQHQLPLAGPHGDGGRLYRASRAILFAHEDKVYPGAFIASLSIPWGARKGDEDRGGYHLVWTRDLFHTANALAASGSTDSPLRALVYLATRQRPDGSIPQNFWVDGTAYWQGLQLDEVAFPMLLARRLRGEDTIADLHRRSLAMHAVRFLIEHCPVTQQDRWEEVSGYSPSTLAVCIAALTSAASFARGRGLAPTADFVQEFSDFLESHIERWTVTRTGTLVPGIPRHYVRIRPARVDDPHPNEGPDMDPVRLPNLPPGVPNVFPAHEVVDGGFLDLVRFGVRAPDDPVIVDSVRVVDAILKVETPVGPVWRRYNHDGYGEHEDGSAFTDWGKGRAWPLLTGERGHFELAAGRDPLPYLRTLEKLATSTGLLPEQVWDEADRPDLYLFLGRPTESATPLAWAHAEYITLLRSIADGRVFDQVPEVRTRYVEERPERVAFEVWRFNRQPRTMRPDETLRIICDRPFRLHASNDEWQNVADLDSNATGIGLSFVDLLPLGSPGRRWRFTFYWPLDGRWQGEDFAVESSANDA
ncbi:MAG TPA: glycoside hydrolase family 15 protein [Thermoplasmata archaeon]|nr:glycoside hydrolase family 15 protein [Thermoplasmata archaeon]